MARTAQRPQPRGNSGPAAARHNFQMADDPDDIERNARDMVTLVVVGNISDRVTRPDESTVYWFARPQPAGRACPAQHVQIRVVLA
jgi:hypothetical protein